MHRIRGILLLLILGLGVLIAAHHHLPLVQAQSSQTYHQILQIGRRVPLAVAWNANGSMLASVGGNEARIYTQNLIELAYIEVPGTISAASWHPHENLLAMLIHTDTGDKLYRWDVAASTLTMLVAIDPHQSPLSAIKWSPDGNFIASTNHDYVAIWDALTGEEITRLFGSHPSGFDTVDWASHVLIAGSEVGIVEIWDVSTITAPSHLHTLTVREPSPLMADVLSPDGSLLATSDAESIHIWDVRTGRISFTLQGHTSTIYSLFWNQLGLASVSFGDRINIWKLSEQQIISSSAFTASAGINTLVSQIAWSADLTKLSAYDLVSKTLQVWDVSTGHSLSALKGYSESIDALAWSPDSRRLVSAGLQSDAYIWDAESGDVLMALGTPRPFYAVAWSPNDKVAIQTLNIGIYDAQTGNLLFDVAGNAAFAWNPGGSLIATGGENNSIKIWSEDGRLLATLEAHQGRVLGLSWHPSGDLIASTSTDATVRIWDITSRQSIITFEQQAVSPTIAWSPNGRLLAIGGSQNNINVIYVWDVALQTLVTTLAGHSSTINSVSWRFDGLLASASEDGTVRIWDISNSQEVSILEHCNRVSSVAWSPDGNKLASGSRDGTIRIWQAESSTLGNIGISTSPPPPS